MPAVDLQVESAEVAPASPEDVIQACAVAARRRSDRLRGIADVGQLLADPNAVPRSDRGRRAQARAARVAASADKSWPGNG